MSEEQRRKGPRGRGIFLLLALLMLIPEPVLVRQGAPGLEPAAVSAAPELTLALFDPAPEAPPPAPLAADSTFPGVRFGPEGADDEPVTYLPDLPAEAMEIAATGDVNLGGPLADVISADPDYPWRGINEHLSGADLAVVNLECAVSTRGTPFPKQFTFRGPPAALPAMRRAGVDVASVDNNHSLDYGSEALLDTLSGLRSAGIAPVGGGASENEAWAPYVVTSEGIRVAFVAASRVIPHGSWYVTATTPGLATAYSEDRLLAEVARARTAADVVVVLIHWGVERMTQPEPYQVSLGHRLVDSGASIVIGHHPHVLQPVVRYRGGIIAYSLGNFVFTARSRVQESVLLRIGVMPTGDLVAARVPVEIVNGQPRPT